MGQYGADIEMLLLTAFVIKQSFIHINTHFSQKCKYD